MMLWLWSGCTVALAAGTVPVPPAIAADSVRPDLFAAATTVTPDTNSFSGFRGLLFASHVRDPLVFQPVGASEPIAIVGPTTGVFAGIAGAVGPLAFGASVPVALWIQSDLSPTASGSGIGDLALDVRGLVLDGAQSPLGVALQGRLTVPLGGADVYLGQPGVSYELLGVGSATHGDWRLSAALGTRGMPETQVGDEVLNDPLLFRLAVGHAIGPAMANLELLGQRQYKGFFEEPTNSPVEVMASGAYSASETVVLRGGLGIGLNPSIGSPSVRVLFGVGPTAAPLP